MGARQDGGAGPLGKKWVWVGRVSSTLRTVATPRRPASSAQWRAVRPARSAESVGQPCLANGEELRIWLAGLFMSRT